MANVPTLDDVRKAGEQAKTVVTAAFEQVRTPLLAAIGAGDVATQAVIEALHKARAQFTERADDLPTDVNGLRAKLDPAELRKLVDTYAEAAKNLYVYLAGQGEEAVERLRSQPQFKKAVEQFDQAAQAAQQRAEAAVEDARELADEVLGKVGRRTRSTGEQAASTVTAAADKIADKIADEVAEDVHEAGEQVAHEVRSTTRKAANRATGARSTGGTGTGTTRKNGNTTK